jgi:ABC-type glycerol-3-phosphate transport system substrate-binding protein
MSKKIYSLLALLLLASLVLTACGPAATEAPAPAPEEPVAPRQQPLKPAR